MNTLKFTKSHEWIRVEGQRATIGITDHAQELLGDLVFVELPDVGVNVHMNDEVGVVESVKAASDYYSPASGEIVAINEDVGDSPAMINNDPMGDGWLYQMTLSDPVELDELLDEQGYNQLIASEE